MHPKQRKQACGSCPFSKACEPGGTGGADPRVYVGQIWGPFLLSCHEDPEYTQANPSLSLLQCAGAAIFRSNVDRARLMPDALLKLPGGHEKVFAAPAELIAHHLRVSLEEAASILEDTPPQYLMQLEMADRNARLVAKG